MTNMLKPKASCECGMDSCDLYGTLGRADRDVPYGLVVIRTDRLAETVAALVEQLEMTP